MESTSASTYREKREDAHCRASMSGAFDSSKLRRRSSRPEILEPSRLF